MHKNEPAFIVLGTYTIRQAGRGLVMTLPQKWADEHGLKAGDKIQVSSAGDFLRLDMVENKA